MVSDTKTAKQWMSWIENCFPRNRGRSTEVLLVLVEQILAQGRLEGAEAYRDSMICDDCHGEGIMGKDSKGKQVTCESCGGYEDEPGHGTTPWEGPDSLPDPAAVVANLGDADE